MFIYEYTVSLILKKAYATLCDANTCIHFGNFCVCNHGYDVLLEIYALVIYNVHDHHYNVLVCSMSMSNSGSMHKTK